MAPAGDGATQSSKGTAMWKMIAVVLVGVTAPLFVSAPLSAADTHDGAAAGPRAHAAPN
jgi:hypothetical protein